MHKLTIFALANATRSSEMHALDVKYMTVSHTGVTFTLRKLTKSSRLGKHLFFVLPFLATGPPPVPGLNLKKLSVPNRKVRKDQSTNLFLTVGRPYRPDHKSTIERWIRLLFTKLELMANLVHTRFEEL